MNEILNKPYFITEEQIQFFQENRYIKLKNVLDQETLDYFNVVISKKVAELNEEETPLEERTTYGKSISTTI